jgi:hypothetical protein
MIIQNTINIHHLKVNPIKKTAENIQLQRFAKKNF